jgi:hypothetical protein
MMKSLDGTEVPLTSVYQLLLLKNPDRKLGLGVFLAYKDYEKWFIQRALKARKAKKGKRWRYGRHLHG